MTQATILKAKTREDQLMVNSKRHVSNACSQGAMKFGDVNDKGSAITKLVADENVSSFRARWNKTVCDLSR
jgi:molybdopterin-containing oxidoreductase family iron-sulfur binding subunit